MPLHVPIPGRGAHCEGPTLMKLGVRGVAMAGCVADGGTDDNRGFWSNVEELACSLEPATDDPVSGGATDGVAGGAHGFSCNVEVPACCLVSGVAAGPPSTPKPCLKLQFPPPGGVSHDLEPARGRLGASGPPGLAGSGGMVSKMVLSGFVADVGAGGTHGFRSNEEGPARGLYAPPNGLISGGAADRVAGGAHGLS